jgi:hypothetical protein
LCLSRSSAFCSASYNIDGESYCGFVAEIFVIILSFRSGDRPRAVSLCNSSVTLPRLFAWLALCGQLLNNSPPWVLNNYLNDSK